MDSDQFRQLEEKCLLLDILIDCEEYGDFDDQVLRQKHGIKQNICIDEIEKPDEESIRKKIKSTSTERLNNHDDYFYFYIVLTSKYIRRLLHQNKKGIISKKIDILHKELSEVLIKKMPETSLDDGDLNKLRVIFLNEISASSVGHLAIGYAEMALSELKELNEAWLPNDNSNKPLRHPYELYALYNKGLTLVHDHTTIDTEKAIDTFSQIMKSFENKATEKLCHVFEKEYSKEKGLFPIFFWLIYIQTQHLTAEAYADLNSSHDLEKTILEALKKIDTEQAMLKNGNHLNEKIKKYHTHLFAIQFCLSKIDSGHFEKEVDSHILGKNWLEAFKDSLDERILSDLKNLCDDFIFLREHPIVKSKLDQAKAIFWLEYTKNTKRDNNEFFFKSFDLCTKHSEDQVTDYSDFAVTFLDGILFALREKQESCWKDIYQNRHEAFDNNYTKIFEMLTNEEWVPRKKELIEKFLNCQDELLRKYEQDTQSNSYTNYVYYQIKLIKIILNDEENKHFKKKWPEWEKVKLKKNLKNILNIVGDCKLIHSFKIEINEIDSNIFPREKELGRLVKFIKNKMNCDFYTKNLRLNTETFYDHLIYKSFRPSLCNHYGLTVLRRWQSFTPALSMGSEVGQKGGGYFVYKANEKGEIDEGLVIDPGFDFLENFFDEGFNIYDIKAILMTHSHPDHSSDFMSIITLVHEMNEHGKRVFSDGKWEDKKLVLFMTDGCYHKFAEQIKGNRDTFHDIVRVREGLKYPNRNDSFLEKFKLEITKANHNDQTEYDSVGYVVKDNDGCPLIGFTGDTQWFNDIEESYKNCPALCMNIGGVVDISKENVLLSDLAEDNKDNNFKKIRNILIKENHLYLPGFYLMARKLKNSLNLIIISELCEEMKGGLRTDLAEKISGDIDNIPVLPEDIGLTVILDKKKEKIKVLCKICQDYWPPNGIVPVETDKDNAIVYLCRDHYEKMREGYSIPKINELELDLNELRKPLKPKNSS